MMLEVVAYGVALLWLVALVPAAVITCLKQQWLLFGVGWLTGGLLWFVGAASLAPASSPWAQRFYGGEKLGRAEEPLRHGRQWRRVGLATATVTALVLALGVFGARPSPLLGVGGKALESSVGNGGVFLDAAPCDRINADTWTCARWDNQFSSTVAYRVKVDDFGCWKAAKVGPAGEGSARRLSGCVSLLDYL